MSDQLFHALRETRPPRAFAEPDVVRRRGQSRARRRAVGACTATFALVGVVAMAAAWPSTLPTSLDRPVAAPTSPTLLTTTDLGPGSWSPTERRVFDRGGMWFWTSVCGDPGAAAPSLSAQRSAESVTFVDGTRQVTQTVERYAPGRATVNLADVRAVVATCRSMATLAVVDDGFAGQEAMLVRIDDPATAGRDPATRYVGVTRIRDAVATVAPVGFDAAYTRVLTVRAAIRLS